ncbi:MAG TPA: M1 family metallopeptidase [Blastocatellia bacterium]|nr:M1 family metallopeptidase [Blastocatellia bacterium]
MIALFVSAAVPVLSRDDYPRRQALDAIHYDIHIEIKDSDDAITAEVAILFAFNAGGIKEIPLDFAGMTVDEVTEDGRPAKFNHSGGSLSVSLASVHAEGGRCRIVIRYHGRPGDGLFIKKNKFGDRTAFADNWPNRAHHWFPSIDHPYDKATVDFFVLAPDRYDIVANGVLLETTSRQNGTKLTHWSEGVPIPTYCMVVGAAEFSISYAGSWNNTPVYYYLYPKDRERGIKDYGRAVRMLEFYSNRIGPYPYEKLALVESSTRFGGMENSSNIFFDEKAFTGKGALEGTVAHEIVHQWFGDSVTEFDWHHLWLSESFATYLGHIFFESADGRERFLELMRADKESYLKEYGADPRPIYDPEIKDLFKLLNANNYQKGGWVLHMLRRVIGDERFFEGVREYYRTYRDHNALTLDLQRIMESHAGQPLDWFFNEWFYGRGYPIYGATWKWDDAAKELRLRISQQQQGALFRMPLDLEFKMGQASRREMVQTAEREQTFTFKLDHKPQAVAIDPDEWVLKGLQVVEEK